MNTKLLYIAAAAFALASCSNEDAIDSKKPLELRLRSGVEQTRAAANTQETKIESGEKAYVWVDDTETGEAVYNAVNLTADGDNGFTGTLLYFPESGNGADIYAMHGGFTEAPAEGTTAFPESGIEFSVAAVQDSIGGADYIESDLLYASKQDQARTVSPVNITFHHMLSKLELVIVIGDGAPHLGSTAAVKLNGAAISGTFKPLKTAESSMEQQAVLDSMIVADTTAAEMTLGQEVSEDFTDANIICNEAVVVPQSMAGKYISFSLADGGTLYYNFPEDMVFESGKKYRYHITLSLTEIIVKSTISPWEEGATVNGDATVVRP